MRRLLAFTLLFCGFISSCSNIKMLTPEEIYSEEFLSKVEGIQAVFRDGDRAGALAQIRALEGGELSEAERAKLANLAGIIHFSNQDFTQAAQRFVEARNQAKLDRPLQSQAGLNLASSYYKMDRNEEAFNALEDTRAEFFGENEKEKYHKLRLLLAQTQNADKAVVTSLIYLLKDKKRFSEINQSEYKSLLMNSFRRLASAERVFLLEKNTEKGVVTPYLAAEEALQRYYFGDRAGAQDVLKWMKGNFGRLDDVKDFVSEFEYRITNFSKVDIGAVGVVLPLSGENERFGKKALMGIDTAINSGSQKFIPLKLITRDNRNNAVVAKQQVQDLVQKHHVSIIIGGLFPATAKEEYLEARKYGALYISLSPVYLDKEEKNHLLIEVPGSVQSQVAAIFSDEFLRANGNKIAMLYPKSEKGNSYVNEVWRKANEGKIKVQSLAAYDVNVKDYREWVKQLLGLKFTRERQEELKLWEEIYSLERRASSIRRIQTLSPIVDFDWVFTPSYPHEAIQIIPAFNYFDAKGLKYVGGPSWMSRRLVNEQRNLGALRFVGDDPEDFDKSFVSAFVERNNSRPSLVETLAYEGMNLGLSVISGSKMDKREDLERRLVNMEKIEGITGVWNLEDGIWIKEMDIMQIRRNQIQKVESVAQDAS